MRTLKTTYFTIIFIFTTVALTACKQTAQDKEYEKKIIGTWVAPQEGTTLNLIFYFGSDNKGYTEFSTSHDEMSWEIKRGKLSTFYKKAPSYAVGYDKYNSKGSYNIKSLKDSTMEVVQLNSMGYEITLDMKRKR